MDEATLVKLLEVKQQIPALVKSVGMNESELTAVRTVLVMFKDALNDSITDLDKNKIDVFLAQVAAGLHGADYKAEITRIYQPRGKGSKNVETETELEKLTRLFGVKAEETETEDAI